ncbi:futalosine hydrolase [Streptomyces hoynatensis]|uniref:Futalosine hydrolase n=1 Tax=Streptomyces hoynatensis TaxID=1141874 RepID=A0A3A9Z0B5_9ACTN|nr:futalosine hydrolase [Streptomyces hoynatensis]RKN41718.1 futalosine hydrolase [Streptomyces hoynatensis]
MHALVVTAVAPERDAVTRGLGAAARRLPLPGGLALHRVSRPGGGPLLDVLAAGAGPAAAAAAAATALARGRYDLAVSAGIGGGFAPAAAVGSLVVADAIRAADLGSQTPEGFADAAALGYGVVEHRPPAALAAALAAATGAVAGTVLTVSTVTGTAARAAELAARHPGAAAEAMEGFGVACAAALHGVPVAEVRAVSNLVGPRDRAAWRIPAALDALTEAFATGFTAALAGTLAPAAGAPRTGSNDA